MAGEFIVLLSHGIKGVSNEKETDVINSLDHY